MIDAPAPSETRRAHDPSSPRLSLQRELPPGMHTFFVEAQKQTDGVYTNPKRFAPHLNFLRRSRSRAHVGAGGRAPCKARRSERREAIVLLMKALMRRMDLVSLRVGARRADGYFIGMSVETICQETALPTYTVERALADVHDAGFVASTQPREQLGNCDLEVRPHVLDKAHTCRNFSRERYIGLPAVRVIHPTWFRILGMHLRLMLERKRAYEAKERKEQAERADHARRLRDAQQKDPVFQRYQQLQRRAGLRELAERTPEHGQWAGGAENEQEARRYLETLSAVHRENGARAEPWSDQQMKAEAWRRMRGPPGRPPSST